MRSPAVVDQLLGVNEDRLSAQAGRPHQCIIPPPLPVHGRRDRIRDGLFWAGITIAASPAVAAEAPRVKGADAVDRRACGSRYRQRRSHAVAVLMDGWMGCFVRMVADMCWMG